MMRALDIMKLKSPPLLPHPPYVPRHTNLDELVATPEPAVAPPAGETAGETLSGQTCDNGLPGVSNGEVCCKLGCGECGGAMCSNRGNELSADGTIPYSRLPSGLCVLPSLALCVWIVYYSKRMTSGLQ